MSARHHTKSVEFRDIAGDPGYQVGNDGSVRSLWGKGARKPGTVWRFLKPRPSNKYGHLKVRLRNRDNVSVHTLVLEAFIGPCPDGLECRHLNGNPSNNRVGNLAWGTHKENMQDMINHGTSISISGEDNKLAKLTENEVREIRLLWKQGNLYQREIGDMYGVNSRTIGQIVLRRIWKHVQ